MLVKICGMRDVENIAGVVTLRPDMLGFIFYKTSPRYVGNLSPAVLKTLPDTIEKVGVFVDAELDEIERIVENYAIRTVQLHGHESPGVCRQLKTKGYRLIKAFGIERAGDFDQTKIYEDHCDFFLFDTHSKGYGGTGKHFDWNLLEQYRGRRPFFLSGGISVADGKQILGIGHPRLAGIDLNSRFEKSPGVKDIRLLSLFLSELH